MKNSTLLGAALLALTLLLPEAYAQSVSTNRLGETGNRFSFSTRFGFNISARFKGLGPLPSPLVLRTTPDGDTYNYDDGYVLTDASGNAGGQTWYWGYDDSASQISGDTILFSRSTPTTKFASPEMDRDMNLGAELTYSRQLLAWGKVRVGAEVAMNYLSLNLRDSSAYSGNIIVQTDAYPYTSGTTPPAAPPAYQGTFLGPGFVIGDSPLTSGNVLVANGATVTGRREFDSDLWGFRLGPYLEFPLCKQVSVSLAGGVAAAVLDGRASWAETVSIAGVGARAIAGGGSDTEVLFGGYIGANLAWALDDRWSLFGGAQYQNLGSYSKTLGGRKLNLDLGSSVFVIFGVRWDF